MQSNETLYKQIKEKMETKEAGKKLASWLKQAERTKKFITTYRKEFREWDPLKFYVTLECKDAFSIRYKGQTVATLSFPASSKSPMVKISDDQKKTNMKYFKLSSGSQSFKWRSSEGTIFRNHFAYNNFKAHSIEHTIESGLIAGLIARNKPTNSALRKKTAVTLGSFPLQFPVPFSACEGTIGTQSGHVDILGRTNNKLLSVWELKSPKAYGSVVRQAYIYALQIYFMINDDKDGDKWLKLFGTSKKRKIDIIVGISKRHTEKAKKDIAKLQEEMKLDGVDNLFSWSIANYSDDLNPHETVFHQIS